MSTDVSEMTDTVEQVAFGAAEAAVEVAADPVGAVRRQVKSFEKKGTPTARRVNRRINRQIEYATAPAMDAFKTVRKTAAKTAAQMADQLDPEKVAVRGLRLVKHQAKRDDMVGDVAKSTLKFFNRSFKTVARVANRLETASELAPRTTTERTPARRPARRSRTRRTRRAA
ncbi:MAG TPA: hypothetical protein VFJ24_07950 [Gaiellales bacterium]|nr:hypothetical protein [Gaiellales bacterium]